MAWRPKHIFVSICFLFGLSIAGYSQKTRVLGKVFDSVTQEPLPFVRVFFKHTKFAALTDTAGKFVLETLYPVDTIRAEMMGYDAMEFKVKKDQQQVLDFPLKETLSELTEFEVRPPKVDPAIAIFKNILRNKKVNNREKLQAYDYSVYNKIEFDLNNITDDFTQRKVFKSFNFIFENIDTTDEKDFLPVFLSETVSKYHYRKNPRATKEKIIASRVSGIDNESVSQFLGDMYQNVNVYENNINVFSKSFISPISDFGRAYYNYYLVDSSFLESDWCYRIMFVPKRKQEPTFNGHFWVNDTTYAIRKIECEIAEDANINFVNRLSVLQEYHEVEKEVWMITRDELMADIYVSNKTMGFYGRKTTLYDDFTVNLEQDPSVFKGMDPVEVLEGANERSEEFWDSVRMEPLSNNEQAVYTMIDTLGEIPQVKTYVDIVSTLISGYKVVGPIEIGPYGSMLSFNAVEGWRFRVGGRTSNNFSTRIELSAYGAYGLLDKQFKYAGGYRWLISKKPRMELGMYYSYDLEQLGRSQNAFREDFALASILQRVPNDKLTLIEEYKGYLDREWFPGFSSQIMFRRRAMEPRGVLKYLKIEESGKDSELNRITTSELIFYTRFAYREKFVSGEFDRISLGTRWPVVSAQYTFGLKNFLGGNYDYRKLILNVNQWYPAGIWGWTRYEVEAGKIWGTLPYPLLVIHKGNQSHYMDSKAFNTMNFFEFVSDRYASLMVTHHFDGLLFNKIPLFRKLKWREVAHFSMVYGQLDEKHERELRLLDNMYTLRAKPFMECGVGIENIFRILRVDMLWRLSYLNNPNIYKFGVQFKLDVDF